MNLLRVADLDKKQIDELIERAVLLKVRKKAGIPWKPLTGKVIALVFEKASTRTRVSFECAMNDLGGSSIVLTSGTSQMGRGEPVKDTARVLSGYTDCIMVRTYGHDIIEEFVEYSSVPVINGLTDSHHPCQVLADLQTIVEVKGSYAGLKIAWVGDGNNMANTWIDAAAVLGFELTLACPSGYEPDSGLLKEAKKAGANITLHASAEEAVKGADVINTDVWVSMGQEEEREKRISDFTGFQLSSGLLKKAKKDAIVLHCLPAHRDEEITDEVIEGKQSVVWQQAENRMHIQKAILELLLVEKGI